jgi:hypothetical protein
MKRRKQKLTLHLPDEFLDLCQQDLIEPEFVLRGFIADLCGIMSWQSNPRTDGYCSNGSDERQFAHDYYERVGYPYWACFKRDAEQPKSPSNRAANLNCRDRQFNLTPDTMIS